MSFVDQVKITVQAGDGGDGAVSFHHVKYNPNGGPNGGDGGDGGDVIFEASNNQDTLANFRYQKIIKAGHGQRGGENNRHGKKGLDKIVLVPVGTMIYDDDRLIVDLDHNQQTFMIAKGGQGGFGNAHFVSSTRQAPKFAEKGLKGQFFELHLELKMIADVGLIGLPNVGKSSLLSKISHARPKIANYPFTTLKPFLGVVDIHGRTILFADIPGLIAGASDGKGLGFDFLRHIERTKILVHVIDVTSVSPTKDYLTIRHELETYRADLKSRPEIIVFNKIDLISSTRLASIIQQFRSKLKLNNAIYSLSTYNSEGIPEFLEMVYQLSQVTEKNQLEDNQTTIKSDYKVINLDNLPKKQDHKFEIKVISNNVFRIHGQSIEDLVNKTDFNNSQSLDRLVRLLSKRGVIKELKKMGAKPGCLVFVDQHKLESLL